MVYIVTRNDVAKKARVSTATVSRVINNYQHVAPETRKKVKKAMEELNYQPDLVARGLKMNKTYTIAFLISDITNDFFTEIYKGIHDIAVKKGYLTSLYEISNRQETLKILINRKPDGIILGTRIPVKMIDMMKDADIPLVCIAAAGLQEVEVSTIVNNYQATLEVMDYLYEKGHRRIGIITHQTNKGPGNQRLKGYKDGLAKFGINYRQNYVKFIEGNDYHYNLGYQAMQKLINRQTDITAIIVNNDLVAIGAMAASREGGLEIPEDLSFVSFDDTLTASFSNPPLTSVKILKYKQGRVVARMLFDLMKGKEVESVQLPTELIVRDSVRDISNNI